MWHIAPLLAKYPPIIFTSTLVDNCWYWVGLTSEHSGYASIITHITINIHKHVFQPVAFIFLIMQDTAGVEKMPPWPITSWPIWIQKFETKNLSHQKHITNMIFSFSKNCKSMHIEVWGFVDISPTSPTKMVLKFSGLEFKVAWSIWSFQNIISIHRLSSEGAYVM